MFSMQNVNKALRNKTLDREICEGDIFLSRAKDADFLRTCDEPDNITVHADTYEALRALPEGYFDLVIADPPYNMRKCFGDETFPKMTERDYEEYTRTWLSLIFPLLREGGSIYVCCDWRSGMVIGRVMEEFFVLRNRITWQREKGRGAKENWKVGCEDIWFGTKGDGYTFNLDAVKVRRRVLAPYRQGGEAKDWQEEGGVRYRDTCPSNFWDDLTVPFWSMEENTAHPTQKPEKLIAKLILASSNEGDMILDPFLGSGTTSVVAKKLGRRYIGIEREATYCSWAEERLERAEHDKKIQGFDGERFYERHAEGIQKRGNLKR